jgi:cell division protein FtsI (penicillin-binding protein 3)
MMEGVVLYGTGKPAQLNGYSSGGKTGTAQKIDPATHTYSKTMHIASFAGIAPVNNPVISIAVVIDDPKGGSYHGNAVSAPVFAEVAQQVLEYLSVPHDIDVRAPRVTTKAEPAIAEDDSDEQGDVNALYAAINDLPSDDPLRTQPVRAQPAPANASRTAAVQPAKQAADLEASANADDGGDEPQAHPAVPRKGTAPSAVATKAVLVSDARTLKVPSLVGLPVRQVVVQAAAAGLEVQISGSGTVREQAPAAGTMVVSGTQIVVRCGR